MPVSLRRKEKQVEIDLVWSFEDQLLHTISHFPVLILMWKLNVCM
jgi:hypothetical protein